MTFHKKVAKVTLSPVKVHPDLKGSVIAVSNQLEKNYTDTMTYLLQAGIDAHLNSNVEKQKKKPAFDTGIQMDKVSDAAKEALGIMPDRTAGYADDFEIFWTAGMVKNNKKKSLSLFKSLAAKNGGSLVFARKLADDVRYRLDAGQMGFDALHPATYLNGERWNDALPTPKVAGISTPDYSGFLGDGNQEVIEHD